MGLKAFTVKVATRAGTMNIEVRATGKRDARRKALWHIPPTYQATAGEVTPIKATGRYA